MTRNYTLLTGATGLLGRYLLRDLLAAGHRLAIVARPSHKETIQQRIEAILQRWESRGGNPLPRPVCLEGDIRREGVALSAGSREWVAGHCRSLIHNAAALIFQVDEHGEPWRTNVDGTRNMLALCHSTGIRQLHYVSTAYVCGLREDLVLEDELDVGQEFRNEYEKSKLAAEKLVREAEFLDQLTVYRPAVIAGDSRDGYTTTYHGLYLYLKLMSVLVRNTEPGTDGVRYTPVRLAMTGDEPRNIVPVDWVSRVIRHLFEEPRAHGHTFHLTPSHPVTPREIIEAGYRYFNSHGVEFRPTGSADMARISDMDRDAHQNMMVYKSYDASDPPFDTTNLRRFANDLPCPELDEAMLHRYWRYGERDRWGKRREATASVSFQAADHLRRVADGKSEAHARFTQGVGLDFTGPGGGQWSLLPNGCRVDLREGISANCTHLLRLTTSEFAEYAGNGESSLPETRLAKHLAPRDPRLAQHLAKFLFPK